MVRRLKVEGTSGDPNNSFWLHGFIWPVDIIGVCGVVL
jgi:hypothetical protein